MILAMLLLAGCASGQGCQTGRTGGWLSSWGSGGASAFTLGLRRTWGECPDRAGTPAKRGPEPLPAPSADPMPDPPTAPAAANPPR
jgi:hypothetical protein